MIKVNVDRGAHYEPKIKNKLRQQVGSNTRLILSSLQKIQQKTKQAELCAVIVRVLDAFCLKFQTFSKD